MRAETSVTSAPPTDPQTSGGVLNAQWPDGHPLRKQILLVLCLSLLAGVIDNTVLNTALPTLARVLHAGTSSLQWIVDAYTLCFAALLIPAGALADRYGRRLSLIGGLIVFAFGSLAAAFAPSAGVLIADRVLMGLGAAFVMPATLSILNAVFPPAERPQAIAAWSAAAGVGIIIGPTLGGLLLAHFWWGSVFLVNVPIVVLALAGVLWVVPETAEPGRRPLDLVGTVLVGGALVAIVDAIIEAPARGWTGSGTLAEATAGLVALALFVSWELRAELPLIDLRIFSSRAFSVASGSVTVTFCSAASSSSPSTSNSCTATARYLPESGPSHSRSRWGCSRRFQPYWRSVSAIGRSSRRDSPSWVSACSTSRAYKSTRAIPPWPSQWRSWERAWAW